MKMFLFLGSSLFRMLFVMLGLLAVSGCASSGNNASVADSNNPYKAVRHGELQADVVFFRSNSDKENVILSNMVKHGLKNENTNIAFTSPVSSSVFTIVYGKGYRKKGTYCKPFLIKKSDSRIVIEYIGKACYSDNLWVIIRP